MLLTLEPGFTRRERRWGQCIAVALWALSAAVLAALAAWSAWPGALA